MSKHYTTQTKKVIELFSRNILLKLGVRQVINIK